MTSPLNILRRDLVDEYIKELQLDLDQAYAGIFGQPLTEQDFKFYLAQSAVHSSNIEGNSVSFDTYLKTKEFHLHLKTKEFKEIEDLIKAYQFARENELNLGNVLKAHEIFSTSILLKKERGRIRKVKVGVRSEGRLIYLAVEPELVMQELEKLFADISGLLKEELSITEVFFFAALIHLVFVNIHPFVDGNGRATRLIEKWFLAKKLGGNAWLIPSEKNYWDNRAVYYKNLRLGVNYYEVKYENSIPFLIMLPDSLRTKF